MSTVEQQLDDLEAQITSELPSDISVSSVKYEGPELVVYTRDPKKFAQQGDLIRQLASKLRKRITVRPDPSVLSRPEQAREEIMNVVPEDAGSLTLTSTPTPARSSLRPKSPAWLSAATGRRSAKSRRLSAGRPKSSARRRSNPRPSRTSAAFSNRSATSAAISSRRSVDRSTARRCPTTSMSASRRWGAVARSAAHRSSSRARDADPHRLR